MSCTFSLQPSVAEYNILSAADDLAYLLGALVFVKPQNFSKSDEILDPHPTHPVPTLRAPSTPSSPSPPTSPSSTPPTPADTSYPTPPSPNCGLRQTHPHPSASAQHQTFRFPCRPAGSKSYPHAHTRSCRMKTTRCCRHVVASSFSE
jgi:hypothetical protein